jgi:outer membrane cobalamin receptor
MYNKKLGVLAVSLALMSSSSLMANEIETIVVVGSTVAEDITQPVDDFTLLEVVMPTAAYTQGGYGGFAGFTERGAQAIHTTVYRNGVPGNDAGSGWYDLGHDISTGNESVKIVSGPNSVLYGSGSLGGTVFLNDDISDGGVIRLGEEHELVSASFDNTFNFTYFNVNNGSVRNDNTENDHYTNLTGRVKVDYDQFTLVANYTNYSYDYDNCFTNSYANSNDCVQKGNKGTISVRNEHVTLGYSFNEAEYFTEGESTWNSDAERFYFDARNQTDLTNQVTVTYGVTANQESYIGQHQLDYGAYAVANIADTLDVGVRVTDDAVVYRAGLAYNGFYANYGTSYRNPTLYELNGDSWVAPNPELDPEEASGFEIGYGPVSVFSYDFDEGIDYNFASSRYTNTGTYKTEGVRYADTYVIPYGTVSLFLGYTDSDQPRVPEYKSAVRFNFDAFDYLVSLNFVNQFNRGVDWNGLSIDDVNTADLIISKDFARGISLAFTVQDMFDNEFEITPEYAAGGRRFFLTLSYK